MPKGGKDDLLLDDDTLMLKVDLSLVINQDIGLKSVKVPSSYTASEMLRKLLDATQVQKLIKAAGVTESVEAVDFTLRVPSKDVYLNEGVSLRDLGMKDSDVLEVRRKVRMTLRIRALPSNMEASVDVDGGRRVQDIIPQLCGVVGVSPDGLGLRVIDRPEFLLNSEALADQHVSPSAVVLLHSRRCFGVPLAAITLPDRVPVIVQRCLQYLEEKGFDQEGIYRLSGSALHLQIFRDVFDKGEVPNFAGYNADAHVVAGLLKLFLREMADPVVPFVLYSKFMEVARSDKSPKACMARYRVLVGKLPVEHMTLLRTLMRHCVRVAAHSVENRMPASNLAAVIGPNILRDQDATPMQALADAGAVNSVVRVMIEEEEFLFEGVEKEYSAMSAARMKRSQHNLYEPADQGDAETAAVTPAAAATAASTAGSDAALEIVTALYDYVAREDNELTIRMGDRLVVLQRHSNDWLHARGPSGADGLVPATYVSAPEASAEADQGAAVAPSATEGTAAGPDSDAMAHALAQDSAPQPLSPSAVARTRPASARASVAEQAAATVGADSKAPPPPPSGVSARTASARLRVPSKTDEQESPLVLARVVYDYEPRDTNEIALETGALINVLHMANEHWWFGTDGARTGLFPAGYVELIDSIDEPADMGAALPT